MDRAQDEAPGIPPTAPGVPGPRTRVLLLAIGWGVSLGVVGGAVAGTALAPGIGTFFGALFGAAVAAAPAVVGAVALWLAARPGTSVDAFRRRVRWVLTSIAVLVGLGWFVWVGSFVGNGDDRFPGPVLVGCVVAVVLLPRAGRSISAVEPAPAGARRGPELAALGVLVAVLLGVGAWLAWRQYLGTDARARRSVAAERDALAGAMGLGELYAYDLRDGAEPVECDPLGDPLGDPRTGFVSFGSGSPSGGGSGRRAVRRARRTLEAAGYHVSHAERSAGDWVYGVRGDRSVTVLEDGGVTVRVAAGCPEPQPALDRSPSGRPRLLAAGHAPEVDGRRFTCPDGDPAEVFTVAAAGPLGPAARGRAGWTVADAAGALRKPCDLVVGPDLDVFQLTAPVSGAPVVRAEVAVDATARPGGAPGAREGHLSVEVAPEGAPARAVAASAPSSDGDLLPGSVGQCPTGTVQGVVVRWDRPRLAVNTVGAGVLRSARPERDYRLVVERDGRRRGVTPIAVEGPEPSDSTFVDATADLLCLGVPGRPVQVRGAASDQLDLGGEPTAAFSLPVR